MYFSKSKYNKQTVILSLSKEKFVYFCICFDRLNMTKIFNSFFLILFWCSNAVVAQQFNEFVKSTPQEIGVYDLQSLKENQTYIAMPFGKKTVLNPEQKQLIYEKVLVKLELVYTKYRSSETFNQQQLNTNRFIELEKLAPEIFENRFWGYELISQTNGNSTAECDKMFHGFVLTFRPNSTKNSLTQEANYLDKLVTTLIKNDSIATDTTPKNFTIKTHYDMTVGYLHDTIWFVDTFPKPSPPDFFYNQSLFNDSTVLNTFARNQNWQNFIVVTDVTGSMSPYSAQVFVWLKAQAENKKAKYFVFFNDGDEKESRKKTPLDTKGIYIVENKSLEDVMKTATKCMKNGSGGGESMENDVEAIIEGLKYYPNVEGVILVADNHEIMRDYDYINKIKVPVHVILCGAENRINIQYMDLVRQTKGTLHTSKSDITNLQDIKENEHFFIEKKEYMYHKGRFHSVYESRY